MSKKKEEVYYDAQGNPVVIKKKRNPIFMGCLGLLLLIILIGSCSAMFMPTEEKLSKEDKEVVEDIAPSKDEDETEDTTANEEEVDEDTETISEDTAETEKEAEPVKEKNKEVSREFKAALNSAQSYVDSMPFSKAKLYNQLTSDAGSKFPAEAAQYAIDNVKVDYKKEAVESANSYNKTMPMSDAELLNQLTSEAGEQFTQEEAQYALKHMDK